MQEFTIVNDKTRAKISNDLIKAVQKYFSIKEEEKNEIWAVEFIKKHPDLLSFEPEDIKHYFKEYAKYGWSKSLIRKAYEKNKRLFSFNLQDLKDKVMIFKDLGYSSLFIIENPLLLSCPSKDIKIKYMFAKVNNFKLSVKYFIQALQKTFARTCFLNTIHENVEKNFLLTEFDFAGKFNINDDTLKYEYPLSEHAVEFIEESYSLLVEENTSLPAIELTEEEKNESIKRINIRNLKKLFKAELAEKSFNEKLEKANALKAKKQEKERDLING